MTIQVIQSNGEYVITGIDKDTLRTLSILTGVSSGTFGRQTYEFFSAVDDEVIKFDPDYAQPYLDITVDVESMLK